MPWGEKRTDRVRSVVVFAAVVIAVIVVIVLAIVCDELAVSVDWREKGSDEVERTDRMDRIEKPGDVGVGGVATERRPSCWAELALGICMCEGGGEPGAKGELDVKMVGW